MRGSIVYSIKVKRPVLIKTIVTNEFKKQTTDELMNEMQLLDSQIMHLELQNRQIQDQFSSMGYIHEENKQYVNKAIEEIRTRLEQLSSLKNELNSHKESINHLALNNVIITGSLENYVELKVGENIYDKFKGAEILIKDGIIQEIRS
jgi:prefoldin subunit 5